MSRPPTFFARISTEKRFRRSFSKNVAIRKKLRAHFARIRRFVCDADGASDGLQIPQVSRRRKRVTLHPTPGPSSRAEESRLSGPAVRRVCRGGGDSVGACLPPSASSSLARRGRCTYCGDVTHGVIAAHSHATVRRFRSGTFRVRPSEFKFEQNAPGFSPRDAGSGLQASRFSTRDVSSAGTALSSFRMEPVHNKPSTSPRETTQRFRIAKRASLANFRKSKVCEARL